VAGIVFSAALPGLDRPGEVALIGVAEGAVAAAEAFVVMVEVIFSAPQVSLSSFFIGVGPDKVDPLSENVDMEGNFATRSCCFGDNTENSAALISTRALLFLSMGFWRQVLSELLYEEDEPSLEP